MARLVECIPNFSCSKEKDEATYNALVEAANSVPGCTLFDAQTDGNHNRCVFTLIGSIEAIEEVAFRLTKASLLNAGTKGLYDQIQLLQKLEDPEMNPHIYAHLIFEGAKTIQWKKDSIFNK